MKLIQVGHQYEAERLLRTKIIYRNFDLFAKTNNALWWRGYAKRGAFTTYCQLNGVKPGSISSKKAQIMPLRWHQSKPWWWVSVWKKKAVLSLLTCTNQEIKTFAEMLQKVWKGRRPVDKVNLQISMAPGSEILWQGRSIEGQAKHAT